MSTRAHPIATVLGACGGAGASCFAAAVATRGAGRSRWPVLIDLDPLGGGIDVLLGAEGVAGARWSGLHATGQRLDPDQLADGLPRWGEVPFLACDQAQVPSADSVRSVLDAATQLGPVVVDAGRWASAARDAVVARSDLVVIVAPAEMRAVTAAIVLRESLPLDDAVRQQVVVRVERPVISPARLAEVVGLELAGSIGRDRGLAAARERGVQARRLSRYTVALAREVMATADEEFAARGNSGSRKLDDGAVSLSERSAARADGRRARHAVAA